MAAFWDRREKPYVLILFSLPFVWMFVSLLMGQYFPDPGKLLMRLSGIWASVYVVAVLSMTWIGKIKPLRVINRYRRFIGLTAFFYGLLHFVIYLVLFAGLSWTWISSDLIEKPYIYVGMIALVIMAVLAITSTKRMMRLLGRRWRSIHRLMYLSAIAVIAHLWWQVKDDTSLAIWFSVFLVPLLVSKIPTLPIWKKYLKKT
ncbi:Sulfoxide reductase heme-binding subunit YedZ [Marinomonas spartinae]|uniref:Protein-methionine-sulfoxide reductase heme-binding subunit MsrQ n=1 Tax=Marinomonas spartinae TaxID=1792290 RepID=A0A1A8TQ36_9GAMM|nr:protein-methionine-sulfoxide reductase heme-binding subunit MsrQ [Marinomonas spartinae]SBS35509.1 Sulfoxide reductase heme-binding subunit YedZ [Marinomonas spartinae]